MSLRNATLQIAAVIRLIAAALVVAKTDEQQWRSSAASDRDRAKEDRTRINSAL